MDEFCLKVFYSFWLLNSRVMEESTFASGTQFVRKFIERRKNLSGETTWKWICLTERRHRTVFGENYSQPWRMFLFSPKSGGFKVVKSFRTEAPQIRIHLRPSRKPNRTKIIPQSLPTSARWFHPRDNSNFSFPTCRCLLDLLGAVFHLQHHGCDVHQTRLRLSTGSDCIHSNDLARVRQRNLLISRP